MFQYSEIIFVDDHCQDGATDIIRAFSQQYSSGEISIVTMSCFQGREKAMRAGVDLAIGDFVFEFESLDMDYDPELIADVYKWHLKGLISSAPYKIQNRRSPPAYSMACTITFPTPHIPWNAMCFAFYLGGRLTASSP